MKRNQIPLRLRLFLPVALIITVVVVFMTIWFVNRAVKNFNIQLENNLMLEAETIVQMFEREADLKLETAMNNLNVAYSLFNAGKPDFSGETYKQEIENQISGSKHEAMLRRWTLNGQNLADNHTFVDSLQRLFEGTITIFQRSDSGFVRISTNVKRPNGRRSTGTYIPNSSPVVQTIIRGKRYTGRAFVVDDWYVTAYEPLYNKGQLAGMLYVGHREKDLHKLESILHKLKIGNSGYPFVFDQTGTLLIHPERKGEFWGDSLLFREIQQKGSGILHYRFMGRNKTMAFRYFERFELFVGATVDNEEEASGLKRDAVIGAGITAAISIVFMLGFLYYFTTKRLYGFLQELRQSRKKLDTVSRALKESEERFKKLFDSTGDDIFVTDMQENIVEVNRAACESLGYTRDELLAMKITDIKTPNFKSLVAAHRQIIYEKGYHTFESEHMTSSGKVLQVEFTSRLVNYEDQKLILSVVRNIGRRLEFERQILSAVIRGEERERQRFAREMHDGLGPLLSALKLYVNELNSATLTEDDRKDLIRNSNELIDEAVSSTRTISNNLMPTVIHSYGLVRAIQAFCDKVNKTNHIHIRFETENLEERPERDLELILFRVISELINNTIKHARAENINILLLRKSGMLRLFFKDDGIGFNVDEILNTENKGMGLKNIISRVKSINGNYNFNSSPGNGFTIKIEINL